MHLDIVTMQYMMGTVQYAGLVETAWSLLTCMENYPRNCLIYEGSSTRLQEYSLREKTNTVGKNVFLLFLSRLAE